MSVQPPLPFARCAFALVVLAGACKHDPAPTSRRATVLASPVPAPDGLVAELSARGPDALWGRLQQGIGGPLSRLPLTTAGALATAAKLDLTVAGEIDGAAPAFAALASSGQSPATLAWVAALALRDFEHAHAALLEGKSPRFTGVDAEGGLIVLSASGAKDAGDPGVVLALSPVGYLVVARSVADMTKLAPYATRTLPSRPKSAHGLVIAVTHAGLAGVLHDRLVASVSELRDTATRLDASLRAEHGGKAPELGDPKAVIQALDEVAHEKLETLADLAGAELTLDATDDGVDLEVTVTPGTGPSARAFAGLASGDATPLLTLPADTEAALLFRDDPASLRDSARVTEERAVAVLKPALREKDAKALHASLAAWADARGPWLTVGLELEGAPALTFRTPTTEPDGAARASRAVEELVGLSDVPVLHAMLESRFSVKGTSIATAAVRGAAGAAATSIATFRRADPHGGSDAAIAWATRGDLLRIAAATSSARALRATKDPESLLLGTDVHLAGKLGTLRSRASFVFVGRRAHEGDPARSRASVVLALGHEKASGWGMLEIDDALLAEALELWLPP